MERLIGMVANILNLNKEKVNLESSREKIEEWDSLAHIQIIAEIESEFEVSIPFEEVAEINTIGQLLKYIPK